MASGGCRESEQALASAQSRRFFKVASSLSKVRKSHRWVTVAYSVIFWGAMIAVFAAVPSVAAAVAAVVIALD